MNTKITKPTTQNDIKRDWHVIDAKGKILGRLATQIAELLMGKTKPYFAKNMDCGDNVIVINAKLIKISGKKPREKVYYRHSGYPGGMHEETFEKLLIRRPEEIIIHGVKGMLPQNKLRAMMLKRLHVFKEEEHTYVDKLKK